MTTSLCHWCKREVAVTEGVLKNHLGTPYKQYGHLGVTTGPCPGSSRRVDRSDEVDTKSTCKHDVLRSWFGPPPDMVTRSCNRCGLTASRKATETCTLCHGSGFETMIDHVNRKKCGACFGKGKVPDWTGWAGKFDYNQLDAGIVVINTRVSRPQTVGTGPRHRGWKALWTFRWFRWFRWW